MVWWLLGSGTMLGDDAPRLTGSPSLPEQSVASHWPLRSTVVFPTPMPASFTVWTCAVALSRLAAVIMPCCVIVVPDMRQVPAISETERVCRTIVCVQFATQIIVKAEGLRQLLLRDAAALRVRLAQGFHGAVQLRPNYAILQLFPGEAGMIRVRLPHLAGRGKSAYVGGRCACSHQVGCKALMSCCGWSTRKR